jgi:predicted HicB family RNase H-like nuclease
MSLRFEYNGYIGIAEYDEESKLYQGNVIDIKDPVTFQGLNEYDTEQSFYNSITDYLNF